jgi:hypothetical protein
MPMPAGKAPPINPCIRVSVSSPRHSEGAERAKPALSIAEGNLVVAIEDRDALSSIQGHGQAEEKMPPTQGNGRAI